MKRLVWLVLAVLSTFLVQAPASQDIPAKPMACCHQKCCAAACPCPVTVASQPTVGLPETGSVAKRPELRRQVADSLRLAAIHALLSEPALVRNAAPRTLLAEPPGAVPLFRAHCSLQI